MIVICYRLNNENKITFYGTGFTYINRRKLLDTVRYRRLTTKLNIEKYVIKIVRIRLKPTSRIQIFYCDKKKIGKNLIIKRKTRFNNRDYFFFIAHRYVQTEILLRSALRGYTRSHKFFHHLVK